MTPGSSVFTVQHLVLELVLGMPTLTFFNSGVSSSMQLEKAEVH